MQNYGQVNKEKYREGTSTDEMGRGDLCQLEELAVSERKVSDHRDLVSRWLLALGAGERLCLYKLRFTIVMNISLEFWSNLPVV